MLSSLRAERENHEDGEGLLVIIIKTPLRTHRHTCAEAHAQNGHTEH